MYGKRLHGGCTPRGGGSRQEVMRGRERGLGRAPTRCEFVPQPRALTACFAGGTVRILLVGGNDG